MLRTPHNKALLTPLMTFICLAKLLNNTNTNKDATTKYHI